MTARYPRRWRDRERCERRIARCAGVADVIEAVRFGRRTGLAVAVRLVKQHYPDNFFLLNQNIGPA